MLKLSMHIHRIILLWSMLIRSRGMMALPTYMVVTLLIFILLVSLEKSLHLSL